METYKEITIKKRQGGNITFTVKKKSNSYTEFSIHGILNCYRNLDGSSGYLPDIYLQPFFNESRNHLVIVEQQEIKSGKL